MLQDGISRSTAGRDAGRDPDVLLDAGHCPVTAGIQLEAMNFFSDTQETASRFGDDIDDLHDVFRCNGVDFGSPEDFFAFARTLKYHSELRGDVLRVVKSVMESETNISFRTILTVIAVASGGPDVATSDREMSVPIKLVIESLIGVGACSHLNADHPDGLYSDLTVKETERAVATDSLSSGGGEAIAHTEVNEPVPILAPDGSSLGGGEAAGYADVPGHADAEGAFFEKATSDSSLDQSLPNPPNGDSGPSSDRQGPLNDYGGSNTLAESLTRLELNSLQLKLHLDSIDQRISRMEPRLENVAPLVLSTPPAHTREEPRARFSAAIPSETEMQLPHSDPPVSNQPGRAETADGAATGPPAVLARLWKDSRQFYSLRRPIALPILVGVATLLLAVSLFWRFGRDTGDAVIRPVNASVEGGTNADGSGLAPRAATSASDSPAGAVRESQVATVNKPSAAPVSPVIPVIGAQANSSAPTYSRTGQGVSRSADRPIQSPKKSAQIAFRSPSQLSSSPAANADTAPVTATETSEVTDPLDRTYNLSSEPLSNHLVNVSSGVMAGNLLSGPKPSYPTLASLTRTQGNVVMQAVISKNGTVEHLHVIKGHRLLRGAAKNAVRNWRYRPYKIGGVPVEVATIVSVDFSLHR